MNKKRLFFICFSIWVAYAFAEYHFVNWIVRENHVEIKQGRVLLPALLFFLVTTFVIPILEEVIFRLPLRASIFNVLLSIGVAIWFFPFGDVLFSGNLFSFYKLLLPLSMTAVVMLLFVKTKYVAAMISFFKQKRFYIPVVLTSAGIFALLHLPKLNYDSFFYAFLFLVVVYFTLALFLSYVRIKFNFFVGLLFHILHNAIPYLILLFYSIRRGQNLFFCI